MNAVGAIFNIDVTNKLLQVSAAGARQKYVAYLEDKRMQQAGLKRTATSEKVEQLKNSNSMSHDTEAMIKSADKYAEKAEK